VARPRDRPARRARGARRRRALGRRCGAPPAPAARSGARLRGARDRGARAVGAGRRAQCVGAGADGALRAPVRLGLGRLCDRGDGLPQPAARRPPCAARGRCRRPADRSRRPHRDRHADLQRGHRHRRRRAACHLRVAAHRDAARRCTGSVRRLPAVGQFRCPAARGRASRLAGTRRHLLGGRRRTRDPRLLPLAPAPHQEEGRQRGRLLPPLGPRLPLHGRARRRQRDERRCHPLDGAADGGPAARRHPADRTARLRPRLAARSRAAVRRPRDRGPVQRRAALLAARRIALLGPQRDPARRALHAPLRPGRAAGHRRAVGCDPVARLRRGRADAPRRLRGLAGARHRWQLRAAATAPDRRTPARPPLVPRQSAERAAGRRAGPGAGAPGDVRDRSDVLPGVAAVAGVRSR